jgi:hypothetical protein
MARDDIRHGDSPTPFSPEFARAQKELSRRAHTDVTRGEFEDLQAQVQRLADMLLKLSRLAHGTQKRQAEVLKAGTKPKSTIILPRELN